MTRPYISICIPAYKRTDFLQRLLDSIAVQTFRDFEVVVTDDSPADEVRILLEKQAGFNQHIFYFKNLVSLGTPANWNEAVSRARGEWIKVMHDDDWFSSPESLTVFEKATRSTSADFLFSAYYDVYLESNQRILRTINPYRYRQLEKDPVTLISTNIIGPPSVLLYRNDGQHSYDTRMKWLVDIDMYIRRLRDDRLYYIGQPLICIGVGRDQVTASVHGNPDVEIPEHFLFLQKTGLRHLRHVLVYDYWWRFFRNFNIRTKNDLKKYISPDHLPVIFEKMMQWQKRIPTVLLRFGPISKLFMLFHYLLNKRQLPV